MTTLTPEQKSKASIEREDAYRNFCYAACACTEAREARDACDQPAAFAAAQRSARAFARSARAAAAAYDTDPTGAGRIALQHAHAAAQEAANADAEARLTPYG
jgi:hypothetical protein